MTDRPIIFSMPMVQALRAGRKTQTRRLITSPLRHCVIGDRLWVREGWLRAKTYPSPPLYVADGVINDGQFLVGKPSIYMPRVLSRVTLVITQIRVQALQDITDADALAEGVVRRTRGDHHVPGLTHPNPDFPELSRISARETFAALWDVLHGSGAWLSNPPVIAITFDVYLGNIDSLT